ncbi:MAG: serine hydrolase [Verrucomicrobia bacterium]|nr:serine hydrolase [Verrucomicrobiota bacterium]
MTTTRRMFLKQLGCGAAGLGFISFIPCSTAAARSFGGKKLPRSTPEAEGVASAGILAFLDAMAAAKQELHSFMIVRHGRVIAEGWWSPYGPQFNHTMYSMSKSFTSTAVGFAVAEGRLTVDDKVVSFFPKDLPDKVSDNLAALRVKDLLSMAVGHAKDPTFEVVKHENWAKAFFDWPIPHAPGTKFVYNSAATYMCSAIVQKLTGQKIIAYLKPRLFDPLGIEGPTWETCPRGICTGGWGLSIQTEGLAKFGQLYLQKGRWKDRQILPAKWVEEATTFKIQQPLPAKPARPNAQNDWLQGYCYQFWRAQHNAYRGDGAFGQFTIVMSDQDAVVVMTSESKNMQSQLDIVWEHLLPAMKEKSLSADPQTQERLQQTLSSLALTPPGAPTGPAVCIDCVRPGSGSLSPTAARVSGKTFKIETNDLGLTSVSFAFGKTGCAVTFKDARASYPIACGIERWQRGETALPGTPPRLIHGGASKPGTKHKLVASGTWKDENTFEMTWRYYETPHHDTVTCRFDGDKAAIEFVASIGSKKRPVLCGKMV